jgi:sugar/nucleoside kinase (ribokinase family)
METHLLDLVSVGHFSIDSIFLPSRQTAFVVLGGSVTYISFAARRLNATTSVISRIGNDFPGAYKWWLQQEGVDLSGVAYVQDGFTTRFELRYSDDLSNRTLCAKNRMPPIRLEDLPDSLKARIIHLAPIAGEITFEVAEKLRDCAQILSLDPQGLIRNFDEDGSVTLEEPKDKRILNMIDIFKSTPKEIQALTGLFDLNSAIEAVRNHGVSVIIVTLGAEGAVVSVEDTIHGVPAYKPERFVDPTGAGDAFIGAFLAEYARGEDCSWCSHVGSAAASMVVEGIGPTSFGDREEIYRRAHTLDEKEIKE